MSTEVQWRGGTTAQHATFTGLPREITVDTTKKTAVVHDGVTPGGFPLALAGDGVSVATAIHAASAKTTPADGDELPIADSAASYGLKKMLWSTVRLWTVPAGHIFGLTLSNNGSDATNDIDIAAGEAASEGDSVPLRITLASAFTKRLDANWAAGTNQGGRYSGAAIANTTYHVWLVSKALGADADVYFDPSASKATAISHLQSETGGAAYVNARRIGSFIRASGTIVAFTQTADQFILSSTRLDISNSSLGTAAALYTLSVPQGIKVAALMRGFISNAGSAVNLLVTSPDESDQSPGSVTGNYTTYTLASGNSAPFNAAILTNTSAQIRARASVASTSIAIATYGWVDSRGRPN